MCAPSRQVGRVFVLTVATTWLSAVSVQAQAVATNLSELRLKVTAGDTIYVTEGGGQERMATVLDLTPSSLIISTGGERRDLAEDRISRIRQRRPDPLWNGMVIGAAAYMAGMGTIAAVMHEGCDSAGCWAANLSFSGGIGAAIGAGIDALIKGRKTIYRAADRETSTSVNVRPLADGGTRGLRVVVAW